MGELREAMGLARVIIDPRKSSEQRNASRARLDTLTGRYLRSPFRAELEAAGRPANLYPAAWRLIEWTRRSEDLVVYLGAPPPNPVNPAGADSLKLTDPGEPWDQHVPASWTDTDRLVAAANAGLLNGYRRILVRSAEEGERGVSLGDLRPSPRVGGLCAVMRETSSSEALEAQRILDALRWEMSVRGVWRPADLHFVCRGFLLQGLRALRIPPGAGLSQGAFLALLTTVATEALAPLQTAGESGSLLNTDVSLKPRISAFYLPQFHVTDENDRWWGRGFTEWSNVSAATPNYPGHFQPKLPEDLGFYDLRLDSVRERQGDLAKQAGVESFMYYHYWFAGHQLLWEPLARHAAQDVEQSFCLMWANENWTRSWDGDKASVLMKQEHETVPATRFVEDNLALLADSRYMSVEGRRVLSVYRPDDIPDFPAVAEEWRSTCRVAGFDLFLLGVEYGSVSSEVREALDGVMYFPPHAKKYSPYLGLRTLLSRKFNGKLFSYRDMALADIHDMETLEHNEFPGVMVAWDNTARRQRGSHIWIGANPYQYRAWLLSAAEAVAGRPEEHRLVFVNAWNEWAEGAVLEPSVEFGHSYLQATRDVAQS